jgi:putative ABC transport system substrate-binding protein
MTCRTIGLRVTLIIAPRLVKTLRLALLALLVLLAVPPVNAGQQPHALPRLCFLTLEPGTLQTRSPRFDAFFQTLRDLGYVEGQSIIIDYLSAADDGGRFPTLVDECVRRKAGVIVPTTTPAALVAKQATRTIPIVMIALGDPLRTGLVNSYAQPEGNVTGMSLMVPELATKRLELLREVVPGIARVLVLTYLIDPIAPLQVQAMREVAPSLGATLLVHDIRAAEDIPVAFDAAAKEGAEGLLVTAESLFVTYRVRVSELAAQHRWPAVYPFAIQVRDGGGLMAYDVIAADLHKRAAGYVDRIFKGAKPADLPVQQPSQYDLVINLKAAQALGLTIPPTLLFQATEVIR